MSTQVIERMAGEDTNLALHVQLCEQRYIQLISKLDQVDHALDAIKTTLTLINTKLDNQEATKLRTYLGWAGAVIVALLGGMIHLVTR